MADLSPASRPAANGSKSPARAPSRDPTPTRAPPTPLRSKSKLDFSVAPSAPKDQDTHEEEPKSSKPRSRHGERDMTRSQEKRMMARDNKKEALELKAERELKRDLEEQKEEDQKLLPGKGGSEAKTIKEAFSTRKEADPDNPHFEGSETSLKKMATESKKSRVVDKTQKSRTEIKVSPGETAEVKRMLRSSTKKEEAEKEKENQEEGNREEPLLTEGLVSEKKERRSGRMSSGGKRSKPDTSIKKSELRDSKSKSKPKSPAVKLETSQKSGARQSTNKEKGTATSRERSLLKNTSKSALKKSTIGSKSKSKVEGTGAGSKKVKIEQPPRWK